LSDQDERSSVRRLGRKDRKRRLDPRGPLFPPEAEVVPPPSGDEAPEPAPDAPIAEVKMPPAERFPALDFAPNEEAVPSPVPAPARSRNTCLPNVITLLFLLGTLVMIGLYAVITLNPYTPFNPFPPFTPLPQIVTATFLPPTATLLPTFGPTPTFTAIPLDALTTPSSAYSFALSNDSPVYIANANDQGCNWASIAGSVTDANGTALNGYGVHITGEGIDSVVFSGAALTFGAGGFELFLNGTPQDKTYSVQLLSPQGVVVSDTYSVATHSSCEQNVAVLTFTPGTRP
jgi:hypothetical protein